MTKQETQHEYVAGDYKIMTKQETQHEYVAGDLVEVQNWDYNNSTKSHYAIVIECSDMKVFESVRVFKLFCKGQIIHFTEFMFEKCEVNDDV